MNLKIHNLGRIKDAELELRPLTVFSGHNGTNKTWVAWAAWEMLRPYGTRLSASPPRADPEYMEPFGRLFRAAMRPLVEAMRSGSTTAAVSLDGVIQTMRRVGQFIWLESSELIKLLGPDAGVDDDSRADFSFDRRSLGSRQETMELTFDAALGRLSATTRWRFPDGSSHEQQRTFTRTDWSEETLTGTAVGLLFQPLLSVLCFPADRAGILLATEGGTEIRGVPPPVEAFADAMRLMRTARVESKVGAELLPLLSKIAGGEIRYAGAKGDERLVLDVSGRALPIGVASSLSRSVAGLSQYLRAFASPGDVILIDELEMNAHPAAQLALVELMAVMVSHGIRIVLTTHSPYVIDHLNNLLEAGRAPEERQAKLAEEFQLKTPRAFLTREQVAVYAFEATEDGSEVKVNDAIDRETGLVSNSTFAPVTERLSRIFNAALDASEE